MPHSTTTSSVSPRNQVLDAVKGVAILLVVLGHVLQTHVSDPDHFLLYRMIYSFHMPLFMLLSGWTAKPGTPGRISKTLTRLIPPTLCWYIVQYFVERHYRDTSFGHYLLMFLIEPDVGLWFLWVLAICLVLLVLSWKMEKRLGLAAYLIPLVILAVLPVHVLGIPLARYYFPYLLMGYLLARYSDHFKPYVRYAVAASLVIYPMALAHWHRIYLETSPMPGYSVHGHALPVRGVSYVLVKFVAACSGSLLAAAVTGFLFTRLKLHFLVWLGQKTLEIYVSHQFFVYLLPYSTPIAITATFTVALGISLLLAHSLKRVEMLNMLLYGGNWPYAKRSPEVRFSEA